MSPVAIPARLLRGRSLLEVAALAAFVAAAGIACHRLARLWTFTIDDAFITARYARNVARGFGPVYNPGEAPVEGTSNLLYVLLLSLAELSGRISIVTFAKLVGLAAGAGVLYVTYRCVRALGECAAVAALPATFLLANASFALWTIGGLETNLYSLLLLLAVRFVVLPSDGRLRYAVTGGLCAALASATRFEGLFLAPVLVAAAALVPRRRRALLVALGVFLLGAVPCLLWKRAYYGSFVPNCGFAKAIFDPDPTAPFAFLRHVLFESSEWGTLREFLYWNAALVTLFVLHAVWSCIGWRADERRALFSVIGTGLVLATVAGFLNVGTWMPGYRYHVPLLPLLAVGAALALGRACRQLGAGRPGWAVAILVAVLASVALPQHLLAGTLLQYADRYRVWLHADHEATGFWLRDHAAKDALIGVSDAGIIPFVSDRPTIDLGGLNDRTIATLVKQHKLREAAEYVLDREPSFLVLARWFVDVAVRSNARFGREYRLVFVSGRAGAFASYHLSVYARN